MMVQRISIIALVLVLLYLPCTTISAFAANEEDTPLVFSSSEPVDGAIDVKNDQLRCYLVFSNNVAYAQTEEDLEYIENNKKLVSLRRADGKPVEKYAVTTGLGHDERHVIYLFNRERLTPLTKYQIVVAPGIQAKNGNVTTEEYVVDFKTDPYCKNGLTVFQNIGIIVGASILVLGITIQLIRRRQNRR